MHVKGTDIAAHDRRPMEKAKFLASVDQALGRFLRSPDPFQIGPSSKRRYHLTMPFAWAHKARGRRLAIKSLDTVRVYSILDASRTPKVVAMGGTSFFEEARENSIVKTAIVSKYFMAWANVIIPNARDGRVLYLDLFAGPGRYGDDTQSTPLLVLKQAIAHPKLRHMLVTHFNDKDENHSRSLEDEISKLPGIESLKYAPQVHNEEVGTKMVDMFEGLNLIPTLFFVDPWGYKGLGLRLINSVLKNWGCDCIFFFNYNRINMGLNNDRVKTHMEALFGEDRAAAVRKKIEGCTPSERELLIVEELSDALKEMDGQYVLPFRFLDSRGKRTTHHLIFVSKHHRGYGIMKDIMAKESSRHDEGVPSFEYSPADEKFPTLFALTRPLHELENMLLERFAGRTLRMIEVFEQHNVGTPFIKKNYKDVLLKLETTGKISANPQNRRKGTFGDEVSVTFPPRR